MKSSEPPKFKNHSRPLVGPSSVNFCQNFCNLSHETVPLKKGIIIEYTLFLTKYSSINDVINDVLKICNKKLKFPFSKRSEAVTKSYMRKGFLIYEEMHNYFTMYDEAVSFI
jgi:hypothetical protein